MRVVQTSVGTLEDSGFNSEVQMTDFANGVDARTEWQTGIKDAGLGSCEATPDIPGDGEGLGAGRGRGR